MNEPRTHSYECWQWHPECARAEVERLRAELVSWRDRANRYGARPRGSELAVPDSNMRGGKMIDENYLEDYAGVPEPSELAYRVADVLNEHLVEGILWTSERLQAAEVERLRDAKDAMAHSLDAMEARYNDAQTEVERLKADARENEQRWLETRTEVDQKRRVLDLDRLRLRAEVERLRGERDEWRESTRQAVDRPEEEVRRARIEAAEEIERRIKQARLTAGTNVLYEAYDNALYITREYRDEQREDTP